MDRLPILKAAGHRLDSDVGSLEPPLTVPAFDIRKLSLFLTAFPISICGRNQLTGATRSGTLTVVGTTPKAAWRVASRRSPRFLDGARLEQRVQAEGK